MSLITEVKGLEAHHVALGIGLFIGVLAPGFLTLYLYKPALVTSLDTFKLLLFSSSITLPIAAVNFLLSAILDHTSESKGIDNSDRYAFTVSALFISCIVQCTALLGAYLFSLRFKGYLGLLSALELVLFLIFLADNRRSYNKTGG
ncbi:MAG: hypothetical protein ACM31P_19995 [Actinomycetota bacterium]